VRWIKCTDWGIGQVSPQEIAAMLRRHGIVLAIVALAACMWSYHLVHGDPGYIDSGGVSFTAPKTSISLFENIESLQVVEEAVAGFMMGSQGEHEVRAAGGTVPYNVAMLNLYNEQYPDYSQPYVTIAVMSNYPEEAQQTFRAVLSVLREATAMLQERVGASPKNEVRAKLVTQTTGPIAQDGSPKRSYAALAILAMIAIYMIARVLDRRRPRRQPRHRGNPRYRILLDVFDR
jgi:hypothetical protein